MLCVFGDHLAGEQGVAAQLEEVVVNADPLQLEHLAPDPGEVRSVGVRGSTPFRRGPRRVSGRGRARRYTLPPDERGSSARGTKTVGSMYPAAADAEGDAVR